MVEGIGAQHAEGVDGSVMAEPAALEDLARQALDGDRNALERLVSHLAAAADALARRPCPVVVRMLAALP